MRDFTQAYVSKSLTFFKKDFMEKWNFAEYHDHNKPAVFLGIYNKEDINIWLTHNSYKVLYFGGSDFKERQLNIVKNTKNVSCIGYGGSWLYNILNEYKISYVNSNITLKNYNYFKSTKLGENIYVYKGIHGNSYDYYKWNEFITPLINEFGKDRISYTSYLPINELVDKYYNNCFIYVKPNEIAGSTTMMELGYMGRKTITNGHDKLPNAIKYSDINDIINIIHNESLKIGTFQHELHNSMNTFFLETDEWLKLDFHKFK